MSVTGLAIIYIILWWIIFFAILPIDVDRIKIKKIEGEDPGAPNNPQIFKKFLITTFVSVIIWFIIYFFLNNDGFLMFILKLFYMNEVI